MGQGNAGSLILLTCLLVHCGGQSRAQAEPEGDGASESADRPGLWQAGAGGAEGIQVGGAPSQSDGGAAGRAAQDAASGEEGGAAEPEARPPIASATRYCEDDRFCFGLSCYAPAPHLPSVCVTPCASSLDCMLNEVCLIGARLTGSCHARCDSPEDCDYGFDCFDAEGARRTLVCFPTDWAEEWERLGR